LRFTLAIMAAQGRDVKLDPSRVAGYRNFGTKLWNATRFAQMNGAARDPDFVPEAARLTLNRWILTELTRTVRAVTEAIEDFRFNEAAAAAYRFVWNEFCDWYLELLKPVFAGGDEAAKREAQACTAHVLDVVYKLLHPFMPFMTEELWSQTAGGATERETLLCHARWPQPDFEDAEAADEINWLVGLVSDIRSVRSEMNVPPAAKAPLVAAGAGEETRARLERHLAAIERLARVDGVTFGEAPRGAAQLVTGEATFFLPLGSLVDLAAETARLGKEAAKTGAEIARINGKLANEKFVANAPDEIVESEREKLAEFEQQADKIEAALRRIRDMG
jgi:valyl-tRNA synthetase